MTDRVNTDIKIVNNTKINHIMVSFTDYCNVISIYRLPTKTKTEKIQGTLTILFYVSPSSHQLQRIFRNFAKFTRKKSTTLQQVTGVIH